MRNQTFEDRRSEAHVEVTCGGVTHKFIEQLIQVREFWSLWNSGALITFIHVKKANLPGSLHLPSSSTWSLDNIGEIVDHVS